MVVEREEVSLEKKKEKRDETKIFKETKQKTQKLSKKKKRQLTDGHALGVDRAQVGVLEQVHDKVLRRLFFVFLVRFCFLRERERKKEKARERENKARTTSDENKKKTRREKKRKGKNLPPAAPAAPRQSTGRAPGPRRW